MDLLTQPCSYGQCPFHIFCNYYKQTKSIWLLEEDFFVHWNDCHLDTMLRCVVLGNIFPCLQRISFIMFIYDDVIKLKRGFNHNVFLSQLQCPLNDSFYDGHLNHCYRFSFLFLNLFEDMHIFSPYPFI